MTERDVAIAAREALMHFDDEHLISQNRLLPIGHSLSYGAIRDTILSALESLETAGANPLARRRGRGREILARCDLAGECHKPVISALGISRRQFYRERREALLSLALAIQKRAREAQAARDRRPVVTAILDSGEAGEAYIEGLRAAGQNLAVWQEASKWATTLAGDPRQTDFWCVASEAARYLGDVRRAESALDLVRGAPSQSYWRSLWTTTAELNLQWISGKSSNALETLARASIADSDERSLRGREAVLLAFALCAAVGIEIACGRWDGARSKLRRASYLAQNAGRAKRQSLLRLSAIVSRLSARLALYTTGDLVRSVAAYQAAVEASLACAEPAQIAETSVYYAIALAHEAPEAALSHLDYGLDIVRRFYPSDRSAELTLEAIPLLLMTRGPIAAATAILQARSSRLGLRDSLLLALAEAKVQAFRGESVEAIERAEEVAAQLLRCGIDALACDAHLVVAESYSRLGQAKLAKRRASQIADLLPKMRAMSRSRAMKV